MTTDPFAEAEHITIPRPHVPYGPEGIPAEQADADYLREAARKLEEHYKPFGSNLRAAVVKLIRDAADAVETSRTHLAAQEPTDAELDALHDAFMAHSEDERSEEYTRTEDGEPYHERICSECGEAVWIKGEHYWAATRANGARKRHHVARAALRAARAARRDEEER